MIYTNENSHLISKGIYIHDSYLVNMQISNNSIEIIFINYYLKTVDKLIFNNLKNMISIWAYFFGGTDNRVNGIYIDFKNDLIINYDHCIAIGIEFVTGNYLKFICESIEHYSERLE